MCLGEPLVPAAAAMTSVRPGSFGRVK